jgi:hypothetical protein
MNDILFDNEYLKYDGTHQIVLRELFQLLGSFFFLLLVPFTR